MAKIKILVAGLLIVVAVGYLIISNTGNTANYFLTIEELLALGRRADERAVTVSGAVLGESIAYDANVPWVTFTIAQVPADPQEVDRQGGIEAVLHNAVNDPAAPRLEVIYADVKPEMLRHAAQVILRGRLGEDGRFYADELLLKCPSRYEEAQ